MMGWKRVARVLSLVAAGSAHAAPALTADVPDAVARHIAPLVGAPAPTQNMELAISLPLRNDAGLQALLRAIYDPASPSFRHYLTVADFTARFGPTAADTASLLNFAATHNLHPRQLAANRRVVDLYGTVADVERAFHVTIGLYKHPTEARIFYAPDREPTPDTAVPILHISGLDDYDLPPRISSAAIRQNPKRRAGQAPGRTAISSAATSAPPITAAQR